VSKFLKKTEYVSATSLEMHRKQALTFLALEGRRLGSGLLMSTAIKLDGNPFKKVKALIQGLIEKLLQEMADEAGHKGFCDTELSKAKNNRDFERERSKKQSADLEKLEVTKEELKESIEKYKEELEELNAALEKASKLRDEEKEDNEATIKEQTEGLNAIKEAIKILKDFYSGASRAKVFFQGVDEDAPDAPPGGAYKGQQKSANKIIGMLQTIQSNFEEAIKEAEEAEAESHRTFVEFDRESKGSISSKETGLSQSESDLKATEIAIKEGHSELEQTMKLLDDALKTLEELKPACLDPGMSYDDRKEAKEREIAALKKALCLLDPEGKEEDC
jgi:DNA repair exonuclease SbcCD ATPase subunit